jgi:diguanylate cyclase (GGDEF)-like protein/PAS domain S-box-containing protein
MASEPRNRWVPCTFLPWEYPFGPHFFKRLLDNLYDGIYFVDVERRILYWNKGAERISGFRSDEVVGRFCYGHLYDFHESHSCDECRENCPIVRAIDSGESINDRVYLRHKDGRRIAVDTHVMPIRSENGEIQGGVEVFRDASATVALEMAYGRLRDLAEKDPLTSVANRRNIDSFLHEQLDVLSRTGLCFSVIMADLDHFKQVNDTWGHEVGDAALVSFTDRLRRQCRPTDLVGRFGGEEFLVVLPGTALPQAIEVAERMRLVTPEATPPGLDDYHLSASFGVAEALRDDTPATILRRVDAALYRAKNHGRHRVEAQLDIVGGTAASTAGSVATCPAVFGVR